MRVGGRGTLALVVAAALGIAGGLTTAFVVPESTSPDPSTSNDPLHLGIALVDLDCTGASIMVVGTGSVRAPLAAGAADNPEGSVRYLRTADSCPTLYAGEGEEVPDYVAYLGPFDTLADACSQRMTEEHKGDPVTRLNAGNQIQVKCICELPTETFPTLEVGMAATPEDGIWIRALQGLLDDIDRNPNHHVTGLYDQQTADLVKPIQKVAATAANGVVDQVTWRLLRQRACGTYDY